MLMYEYARQSIYSSGPEPAHPQPSESPNITCFSGSPFSDPLWGKVKHGYRMRTMTLVPSRQPCLHYS